MYILNLKKMLNILLPFEMIEEMQKTSSVLDASTVRGKVCSIILSFLENGPAICFVLESTVNTKAGQKMYPE